MMKQVMKRAWVLAKQGASKFGGKVREYLASSLSIAWREIRNMKVATATFVKNGVEVFVKHLGGNKVECSVNGITTIAIASYLKNTYCYNFENASEFLKQIGISAKSGLIASDTAKIFRDIANKEISEKAKMETEKNIALYIEKAKQSEDGIYVLEHDMRPTKNGLVEYIRTIDVNGKFSEKTIKHH